MTICTGRERVLGLQKKKWFKWYVFFKKYWPKRTQSVEVVKLRIAETINIRKFIRTWDRCRIGRVGSIIRQRRLGNWVEGWRGHEVVVIWSPGRGISWSAIVIPLGWERQRRRRRERVGCRLCVAPSRISCAVGRVSRMPMKTLECTFTSACRMWGISEWEIRCYLMVSTWYNLTIVI